MRQSTIVRSDVAHTFEAFVRTIGAWWPVQPLSVGKERAREVTVEQRPGGRVYETWDDGTTVDWGDVLAWDPPGRFVMSWSQHAGYHRGRAHLHRPWPRPHPGSPWSTGAGSR